MDISLQVHFGGIFTYVLILTYTNGIVIEVVVDTNFLAMLDIKDIVRMHRYVNIVGYFYKFPRETMEDGR